MVFSDRDFPFSLGSDLFYDGGYKEEEGGMMENIDQMRERHKQEIETLQKKCKHKKLSGWMEEWWAIGHSMGSMVKTCTFCGKIIKRKGGFKLKYKVVKQCANISSK